MRNFPVHTIESAPERSKPALRQLQSAFGMIPNIAGVMATSPVLINSLVGLFGNVHGGSFGLQIGAEATDFVLLFMNSEGLDSLLSNKFTLGADASVAAGPVGRAAGADTDAVMRAKILSYSRSRGLFAGLELKGVVITPDEGDMRDVYGKEVTTRVVLKQDKDAAPASVREFPATLNRYSARRAKAQR